MLIGNIRDTFYQILDLSDYYSNYTLTNLIMIVGSKSIQIYNKFSNGTWLNIVKVIAPTQNYCKYYILEVLNQTSAKFGSICSIPNF